MWSRMSLASTLSHRAKMRPISVFMKILERSKFCGFEGMAFLPKEVQLREGMFSSAWVCYPERGGQDDPGKVIFFSQFFFLFFFFS